MTDTAAGSAPAALGPAAPPTFAEALGVWARITAAPGSTNRSPAASPPLAPCNRQPT